MHREQHLAYQGAIVEVVAEVGHEVEEAVVEVDAVTDRYERDSSE